MAVQPKAEGRWTEEQKRDILRLRARGLSVVAIGARYDRSGAAIYRLLHSMGAVTRKADLRHAERRRFETAVAILDSQDHSTERIATIMRVPVHQVYAAKHRLGIGTEVRIDYTLPAAATASHPTATAPVPTGEESTGAVPESSTPPPPIS